MQIHTNDGPIEILGFKRNEKIRAEVSKSYQADDEMDQLKMDAIMSIAKLMDDAFQYDSAEDWQAFSDQDGEKLKEIGQNLYSKGGMPLMLRTVDELWTCINLGIEKKVPGIKPLEHYEMCVKELDWIWNRIGNLEGEPIKDYWIC
ncbi:MAG: hypothetical protein AB8G05_01510 [Oligoflexales bacterium]